MVNTELHDDADELLIRGARELGVELTSRMQEQFGVYLEELQLWNWRMNLTALRQGAEVVRKHFLDALAVLSWVQPCQRLLDLGSGAGFPGLPLKLASPEMQVTLVEARGKKARFLTYLILKLGLRGVEVRQVYLTPKLSREWGPRWDGVITRATLPLGRLMALAAPLLRDGGRLLAMKGPGLGAEEWEEGVRVAAAAGLKPPVRHEYRLPEGGEARLMVEARREVD